MTDVATASADSAIKAAADAAAQVLRYVPDERPETTLVKRLREALDALPSIGAVKPTEGIHDLTNWTRKPGTIDIEAHLEHGPPHQILIEAKVGKPDESGWDAIKLADVQAFEQRHASGYLVSDSKWATTEPLTPLFDITEPMAISAADLIARWPSAWLGVLKGGRGIRPIHSVGGLVLSPVARAPLALYAGRALAAVRVEPDTSAPVQRYDTDGWPEGYEPPVGMRANGRAADAARKAGGVPAGDTDDPCHGYPWFAKWSQQRLNALVPTLSDDQYVCLRKRLNSERAWSETDLRTRVDPLRQA